VLAQLMHRRSNAARPDMARTKGKRLHPNAVHLTVASVLRAARFYEEKLGFKSVQTFPDEKPVWAKLALGAQVVMLGELPSLQEARQFGMDQEEIDVLKQDARAFARGTPGTGVGCYLEVPNVDAFARRLKKRRVKPLLPPKTQFYGLRELQIVDPDGYRLVFYTRVPPPAPPAGDAPAAG
jgi:uncharacterized glyoxalase superfamily protein PhnB